MNGMCDTPGCQDVGAVRPVVIVYSKKKPQCKLAGDDLFFAAYLGEERYGFRFVICMDFCPYHLGTFNKKKFLSEVCWSVIENHCKSMDVELPSKDSAEIEWEESCGANGLAVDFQSQSKWHQGHTKRESGLIVA